MANEEHVARLKQGVGTWNAWRRETLRFVRTCAGRTCSGYAFRSVSRCSLEQAELPVQARANHDEVVVVAAAVEPQPDLVAENQCAGVAHPNDAVRPKRASAVGPIKVDVQALNLGGQVVGEGILKTAPHRVADVVLVAAERAKVVGWAQGRDECGSLAGRREVRVNRQNGRAICQATKSSVKKAVWALKRVWGRRGTRDAGPRK